MILITESVRYPKLADSERQDFPAAVTQFVRLLGLPVSAGDTSERSSVTGISHTASQQLTRKRKTSMQLPKDEQEILATAFQSTASIKPGKWMIIVGLLSGGLMIAGGVKEYFTEGRGGLRAIGYGGMFAAYCISMYEYLKFKSAAFSLIRKLQSQRENGQ